MAARTLQVPDEEIASLRQLVTAEPDELSRLAQSLECVSPCMRWEDMADDILSGWEEREWASAALETAWRLSIVSNRLEMASAEFVGALGASLADRADACWTSEDRDRWDRSVPVLERILSEKTAFGLAVKSLELLTEQAVFLRSVRIVTDIRPVFDSAAVSLRGMALFHDLVLRCQEGEARRDIHVACDDRDLEAIQAQLDRAKRKARLLRETCSSAQLMFIPLSNEHPTEGEADGCSSFDGK